MRAIWTGSISFGLINIPVKLYSASEEKTVSFDLLHKTDLSPIRYARFCKEEEKEVPYQDIVKGYEYQPGEYIVINEEDLKKTNEKSKNIEILHFAFANEIDFVYFERPYYLEPGKGADKAYALLRETLKASKKVAIVKFIFKNKEHLGILKEHMNSIVLDQMRFYEEMRSMENLKFPSKDLVNKKEMDMSLKLVDQLTETFHPEKFHDEYTKRLKDLIEGKIKLPKKIKTTKSSSQRTAKVHDITALLEASLKEAKIPKKTSRKRA